MTVQAYAPPADLIHLVRRFLVLRSAQRTLNTLLPTSGVTLVFRVSGAIFEAATLPSSPLPPLVVTGPRDFPRSVIYGPGTLAYVVELVPGAAQGLVGGALEDLWGTTVAAREVLPLAPDLEEALRGAPGDVEALGILAEVVRSRAGAPAHRLVAEAASLLARVPPTLSVRQLVDSLGTNKDSLEKRFRRDWGATPKVVLRIERLRGLIASWGPEETWADRAHRWGYSDQSHFNHEFRSMLGMAPGEFVRGDRW